MHKKVLKNLVVSTIMAVTFMGNMPFVLAEELTANAPVENTEIVEPADIAQTDLLNEEVPLEVAVVTIEEQPSILEDGASDYREEKQLFEEIDSHTIKTVGPVELNEKYEYKDSGFYVQFTKLKNPASITIKEIELTQEEIEEYNALYPKAYEVTSEMENKTFEYNLRIPVSPSTKDVTPTIAYSENGDEFESVSETVNVTEEYIKVEGLDHFTIFISADTNKNTGTGVFTPTGVGVPRIRETATGQISTGTLVLNAPAGFEFRTAAVKFAISCVATFGCSDTSNNINNLAIAKHNVTSMAADKITINIFEKSEGPAANRLTFVGLQLRPINGSPIVAPFKLSQALVEGVTFTGAVFIDRDITFEMEPGLINATNSTVTVSKTNPVVGEQVTATVTLLDSFNNPIGSHLVSLASDSASTVVSAQVTSDALGKATFTVDSAVAEAITLTATDDSAAVTLLTKPTVTFGIILPLDTTPPVIARPRIGGSFNPYVSGFGFQILANVSDADSGVDTTSCEYSIDGGATWLPSGYLQNLDGSNKRCAISNVTATHLQALTILMRVKDLAGNQATSLQLARTADTTHPVLSGFTVSPANDPIWGINPTFSFTATEDLANIAKCEYRLKPLGGSFTAWFEFAPTTLNSLISTCTHQLTGLVDGQTYDLYYRARTTSGTGVPSPKKTFTYDATAPTLNTISIYSNNPIVSLAKPGDLITITFNSSEALGSANALINGNTASATNVSGNAWKATYVITTASTEGLVTFSLIGYDGAGNASSTYASTTDASSVTFDKTLPTTVLTPIPTPSKDTNPLFTGSASDNLTGVALVEYRLDGGAWQAATATDGAFNSLTELYNFVSSVLPNGTHTFEVRATDKAGNIQTSYSSQTVLIDDDLKVVFNTSSKKSKGSNNNSSNNNNDANQPNVPQAPAGQVLGDFAYAYGGDLQEPEVLGLDTTLSPNTAPTGTVIVSEEVLADSDEAPQDTSSGNSILNYWWVLILILIAYFAYRAYRKYIN